MQNADLTQAAAALGRKGGQARSPAKTRAARANARLPRTLNYFWLTLPQNQGQMVTASQPQVAGRPEGDEGRAKGLRLTVDASERTWQITKGRRLIATGSLRDRPAPTVAEAIQLAAK